MINEKLDSKTAQEALSVFSEPPEHISPNSIVVSESVRKKLIDMAINDKSKKEEQWQK